MTNFAAFLAWLLAALMPATVAMPSAWEGVSWGMSIEQAGKAFSVPHRPAEAAYSPDTKWMKFDHYQTGRPATSPSTRVISNSRKTS